MGRNNTDIHGAHFEPCVNFKGFLHMTLLGLLDPAGEGTTLFRDDSNCQSTRHFNPEDLHCHQHRCENLKSHLSCGFSSF